MRLRLLALQLLCAGTPSWALDAGAEVSAPRPLSVAPSGKPNTPATGANRKTTQGAARQADEGSTRGSSDAAQHELLRQALERFERGAFPAGAARSSRSDMDRLIAPLLPPPEGSAAPSPIRPPDWVARLEPLDLPMRWHPKIVRYLRYYRDNPRGRAIMRYWLQRSGRYRKMLLRKFAEYGMPKALLGVVMIESGFDPGLTSRVGAAGLWQFMTATGRGFGLARDHWIDGRRNPERSTDAALRYLRSLHERFNSWELALAAYNAGFGAVLNAVQKYNTNDYWRLCDYEAGLPWATTFYVPKILAAALVATNPQAFGLDKVALDPELRHELVALPRSLTTARLARACGVTVEQIKLLNPELRRERTAPGRSWVRVPPKSSERCYATLRRLAPASLRPQTSQLGDTWASLARAHGLSEARLRAINGVRHAREIYPGLVLLVPARTSSAARGSQGADAPTKPNERQLVALPAGVPQQVRGRKRVFYRVVLGDTLERVAERLGVTPADLLAWNALAPKAHLISKMVLQAFIAPGRMPRGVRLLPAEQATIVVAGSSPFLDLHEERKGRRRLSYTIRPKDSLARIARRFGLSARSLMRINHIGPNATLRPGATLIVYAPGGNKAASAPKKRTSAPKKSRRGPKKSTSAPKKSRRAPDKAIRTSKRSASPRKKVVRVAPLGAGPARSPGARKKALASSKARNAPSPRAPTATAKARKRAKAATPAHPPRRAELKGRSAQMRRRHVLAEPSSKPRPKRQSKLKKRPRSQQQPALKRKRSAHPTGKPAPKSAS